MNTTGNAVLDNKIEQLLEALIKSYVSFGNAAVAHLNAHDIPAEYRDRRNQISFELRKGKRYSKLRITTTGQTSIHAFIENATGFLYKPAGLNAPAKHVRYKLLDHDSFADCLKRADWAGGYLYLR